MKTLREMVREVVVHEMTAVIGYDTFHFTVGDVGLIAREWYGPELDAAGIGMEEVEAAALVEMDLIERIGFLDVQHVLQMADEDEEWRALVQANWEE